MIEALKYYTIITIQELR